MAVKETPRLSDILARFRAAQEKIAADEGMAMPPEGGMPPEQGGAPMPQGGDMPPMQDGMPYGGDPQGGYPDEEMPQDGGMEGDQEQPATAADVAAAAQAVEDAEGELVNAKETMQDIAEDFMNEHTAALAKEAALFGEIFASSCMGAMERNQMISTLEKTAYDNTMSAIQEQQLSSALSSCFSEAYVEGIAKIAGYEDGDDLAEAAGMEDAEPEEIAEAISDYVDAGGDVEELADAIGDELGDDDVEELGEELEDEADDDCDYDDDDYDDADGDIDLGDIEKEAYERTLYAMS